VGISSCGQENPKLRGRSRLYRGKSPVLRSSPCLAWPGIVWVAIALPFLPFLGPTAAERAILRLPPVIGSPALKHSITLASGLVQGRARQCRVREGSSDAMSSNLRHMYQLWLFF
jgi:hypothetical protein